jgi:cytochrome b561
VPALPATMPRWQVVAARANHALLYIFILIMPISGFVYTAAGGFPVPLFYLYDLANLVPEHKAVADAAKAVHLTAIWGLVALVALHVAAAAYHGLVRRDGIFGRMVSPGAAGRSGA